uniref:Tail tube protein n=1 Tax=Phage PS17 TaxID=33710 RepID=Q38069_9CAUD|nr:tail tube protein [Phage PS17]
MAMIPQVLTNTNLFIDGISFQGDVPSLTLAQGHREDRRVPAAGAWMAPSTWTWGWSAWSRRSPPTGCGAEALNFFGLADGTAFRGVFRGAFKAQKGKVTAVTATIRGTLKEVDPGDWKAGDKAEFKYSVGVTYYKLEVDGRVVFEIDPLAPLRGYQRCRPTG